MGGLFGVASKEDCVLELFYGVDYHSHLGTRRGGMATHGADGFNRQHMEKAASTARSIISRILRSGQNLTGTWER